MDNDLITVIVPVYNVSEYLKQCIESIIGQTYKNLEIILIDDGSTDDSLEIIKQYAKKDNRIKYYTRENKGVLYTRVEGIKKANGKYLTYVDSDDWLDNNAIEIMYNKIIEHSADVVKCNYREINNNSKIDVIRKEKETIYENDTFDNIYYELANNYLFHNVCTELINTRILKNNLKEFDYEVALGDDLEINISYINKCNKIVVIPNVLYNYRTNNNSITKGKSFEKIKKRIDDILKSYGDLIAFIKENSIKNYKSALEKTLKEINHNLLDLAYVKNVKHKEINDYLESVFKNKLIEEIINDVKYKEFDDRFIKKFLLIKSVYKKNYKLYYYNMMIIGKLRSL